MRLSFFGLGYVGTVYAAGFSSRGHLVVGYDIDRAKLEKLSTGSSPFFEPGLDELIDRGRKSNTFRITSDPKEAVLNSDITFITVGTPNKPDGSIDLGYIIGVSEVIGKALIDKKCWHLIVVKSTVIPGTTIKVVKEAVERTSGKVAFKDFGLAMNPEFLREGSAVEDFSNPDRVVIGTGDKRSRGMLEELYSEFECPKILTDTSTAELVKYANNAFLAMKVSFINMVANICQQMPGTDVMDVASAIGFDKRIGAQFLRAGAGWGGSCWPKDLKALEFFGHDLDMNLDLIEATLSINDSQPNRIVDLAESLVGTLIGKRIAVLGLAFKPDTDDVREAVSMKIIVRLLEKGAKVIAYDPVATKNFRNTFNMLSVEYSKTARECIKDAECAVIVTEWEEFRRLAQDDYLSLMKYPALVDGRRIYHPEAYSKLHFKAIGLGSKYETKGN